MNAACALTRNMVQAPLPITHELRLRRAWRGSGAHRRKACGPLEAVLGGIEERCLVEA